MKLFGIWGIGDNLKWQSYADLMADSPAHLTLNIDYKQPIELGDFVSAFTSLASQFERFIKQEYPELVPESRIFVREIRKGSIEADLLTMAWLALPSIIGQMEQVLVLEDFIRRYGSRLGRYFSVGGRSEDVSKTDLTDFMGAVAAIARDPDASARIEAAYFQDDNRKVRAAIEFDSAQARVAVQEIEHHRREIEDKSSADYQRVIMTFKQSNIKDTAPGRRTGEWVEITQISEKELPLVYASELAEERIKHEIREAPDNVYKKGFVVDVNVETRGGKPIAYRVFNVHQVIDLPDDT